MQVLYFNEGDQFISTHTKAKPFVPLANAEFSIAEARKQGADGKIAYGRASFENGRKQGEEETRAAIREGINSILRGISDEGPYWRGLIDARAIVRARGEQAEPKQDYCDCGRHEDGEGNQIHYPPCPYYKPPEPKCTCWLTYNPKCPAMHHKSPGPVTGNPVTEPAPLEKLSSYDDREVADKVDELVERVNRIEARGRP